MNIKNIFFGFVGLFAGVPLVAQTTLWEKTYGGTHAEFLYDVQATPDYGYILVGSSLSNATGNKTEENVGDLDYWLWKMNERGDLEWQKSYGGTASDQLISLKLTPDAGYILAGTSESPAREQTNKNSLKTEPNFGAEDFWILKLNAFGTLEWQKTIGGVAQDLVTQIHPTADGGYIIGGSSASGKTGNKTTDNIGALDYWVVKLTATGTIEWQKTFGGLYNDELKDIIITNDGGYLVGGISNSPLSDTKNYDTYGGNDGWLLKLDKNGNQQWQVQLGGKRDDQINAILKLPNGNFLVGGSTQSKNETRNSDLWIVELNSQGQTQWEQTYDYDTKDVLTSVIRNTNNTYIIGAYTMPKNSPQVAGSPKGGMSNSSLLGRGAGGEVSALNTGLSEGRGVGFLTLCIDAQGNKRWETQQTSPGTDILRKIIETRDGSYLLAGTRKYNSTSSLDREGRGVKSPSDRGVPEGRGVSDFYILKQKDDAKETLQKASIEALPNPTEAFTNIVLGEDYTSGTLTIYDLAGRQLYQTPLTGSRTQPINLSPYPEGIYIAEAKTNNQKASVKIIKK